MSCGNNLVVQFLGIVLVLFFNLSPSLTFAATVCFVPESYPWGRLAAAAARAVQEEGARKLPVSTHTSSVCLCLSPAALGKLLSFVSTGLLLLFLGHLCLARLTP